MKIVIQRVNYAKLYVKSELISEINNGLLVLLGVGENDTEKEVSNFAEKILKLRIFPDENNKINLGLKDIGGEIMLVSNFTLYGDTSKNNRPSFSHAAKAEIALVLYNKMYELLNKEIKTVTGVFGEHMCIDMMADGPVTLIME